MKKIITLAVIIISTLTISIKPIQARPQIQTIKYAINLNWCGHIKKYCAVGKKALDVAWCESRFNIWARNGQYLGLFQMGNWARNKYGHSNNNVWLQVKYAHEYYKDAGWGPWTCA